jgi:hypothetical protein
MTCGAHAHTGARASPDVAGHHEYELPVGHPFRDALDGGSGREFAEALGTDAFPADLATQRIGNTKTKRKCERAFDRVRG